MTTADKKGVHPGKAYFHPLPSPPPSETGHLQKPDRRGRGVGVRVGGSGGSSGIDPLQAQLTNRFLDGIEFFVDFGITKTLDQPTFGFQTLPSFIVATSRRDIRF